MNQSHYFDARSVTKTKVFTRGNFVLVRPADIRHVIEWKRTTTRPLSINFHISLASVFVVTSVKLSNLPVNWRVINLSAFPRIPRRARAGARMLGRVSPVPSVYLYLRTPVSGVTRASDCSHDHNDAPSSIKLFLSSLQQTPASHTSTRSFTLVNSRDLMQSL